MTPNDRRVLAAVERAQGEWDGFAPHGARDAIAVRRLCAAGMIDDIGIGECQSCREPHEVSTFVLTDKGREALQQDEPAATAGESCVACGDDHRAWDNQGAYCGGCGRRQDRPAEGEVGP